MSGDYIQKQVGRKFRHVEGDVKAGKGIAHTEAHFVNYISVLPPSMGQQFVGGKQIFADGGELEKAVSSGHVGSKPDSSASQRYRKALSPIDRR